MLLFEIMTTCNFLISLLFQKILTTVLDTVPMNSTQVKFANMWQIKRRNSDEVWNSVEVAVTVVAWTHWYSTWLSDEVKLGAGHLWTKDVSAEGLFEHLG